MSAKALEVSKVSKAFGGLLALKDVTFTIGDGELIGLIGPNGAGKTTLMNLISGVFKPTSGEIRFDGQPLTQYRPNQINHLGIARTFQIPKPFIGMTVWENVLTAAIFGGPRDKDDGGRRHAVDEALKITGLSGRADDPAEALNVAGRKRLELARALAMKPRLLLLDEVMAGLNLKEIEGVMRVVEDVNRSGVTVILIEHVMKAVMGLARRIIVLHHGEVLADGSPQQIGEDPAVIEAYLGKGIAFAADAGGRR